MSFEEMISPIADIIADARKGQMFILVDDEDRENEGDLILPAEKADAAAINFMAKHGRGLICLALEEKRVTELGLSLMSHRNGTRHQTAFTVSIEAREGVTTGISAADRARTISVAIDPKFGPDDIVTPGHVFPLIARPGGVLVRAGHTEASVDIARLSGLNPAGVVCEVMNDDGSMARRDDLMRFAQFHNLKIGTIRDLIAYRRRYDHLVERTLETSFESQCGGQFRLYVYTNKLAHAEHVVLVKGDITGVEPVHVRMHALSVLDDVLKDAQCGRAGDLQASMEKIARIGRGVIVLIREPMPTSVSDAVQARLQVKSLHLEQELRDYGIGAQILHDLGVRQMVLLSNRKKNIVGLEGYGLEIVAVEGIGSHS